MRFRNLEVHHSYTHTHTSSSENRNENENIESSKIDVSEKNDELRSEAKAEADGQFVSENSGSAGTIASTRLLAVLIEPRVHYSLEYAVRNVRYHLGEDVPYY